MYAQPQELSGIFDWIGKAATKVAGVADSVSTVADTVNQIKSGDKRVAVVDKGISIVGGVPGKPYAVGLPLMPLLLGGGVLLAILAMRRR